MIASDEAEGSNSSRCLPIEEQRRIWLEECPQWAESWNISPEEYLSRAHSVVNELRGRGKVVSGIESLHRHKGQDMEAYNAAFSAQYGKVFTINDLHMFSLRR